MQATIRARAGDGILWLAAEDWDLSVIHSLPVPVVDFAHVHGDHCWSGEVRHAATPPSQILNGYRLNLFAPAGGVRHDFAVVSAKSLSLASA